MQTVISSAFETSLGLGQFRQLAAAIQRFQPPTAAVYHGLGTAAWFAQDSAAGGSVDANAILPEEEHSSDLAASAGESVNPND